VPVLSVLQKPTEVVRAESVSALETAVLKSEDASPSLIVKAPAEDKRKDKLAVVNIEPALSAEVLATARYSIQVGMYGRLNNAENMVSLLQEKNFEAYVSTYINKKEELRYNVRLGYFSDKKSALAALASYRQTEKSDSYLVNFKTEDRVKLAAVLDADESANDEPATIGQTLSEQQPAVDLEKGINEVTQAEINTVPVNNKAIKTN